MKIEFNKDTLVKIGDGAWRVTKHIVKKGIQHTVMETAGSAALALLDGNTEKAKDQFKLDTIVGPKTVKTDKPKKGWFGKKNKEEVTKVTSEKIEDDFEEIQAKVEELTQKVEKELEK